MLRSSSTRVATDFGAGVDADRRHRPRPRRASAASSATSSAGKSSRRGRAGGWRSGSPWPRLLNGYILRSCAGTAAASAVGGIVLIRRAGPWLGLGLAAALADRRDDRPLGPDPPPARKKRLPGPSTPAEVLGMTADDGRRNRSVVRCCPTVGPARSVVAVLALVVVSVGVGLGLRYGRPGHESGSDRPERIVGRRPGGLDRGRQQAGDAVLQPSWGSARPGPALRGRTVIDPAWMKWSTTRPENATGAAGAGPR